MDALTLEAIQSRDEKMERVQGSIKQVRVENEKIGDTAFKVVYLSGKITALNGLEINHRLKNIFDDGSYNVIIDITHVTYMDSKGMAMLLALSKTIEQNNGRLVLAKPSPFVKELLELTNLNSYFTITETLADARSMFGN